MFNDLRCQAIVHFVDVGGFYDHLSLHFITMLYVFVGHCRYYSSLYILQATIEVNLCCMYLQATVDVILACTFCRPLQRLIYVVCIILGRSSHNKVNGDTEKHIKRRDSDSNRSDFHLIKKVWVKHEVSGHMKSTFNKSDLIIQIKSLPGIDQK